MEETSIEASKELNNPCNNELRVASKRVSPKERVDDYCGDENILIRRSPTFLEAGDYCHRCSMISFVRHSLVLHDEKPEGQKDSVMTAKCRLSDICCDRERLQVQLHPIDIRRVNKDII